jgi:hypothetical protein
MKSFLIQTLAAVVIAFVALVILYIAFLALGYIDWR